jgi:hypothetical protein
LNLPGMLFANRCTWLHILSAVAELTATAPAEWLNPAELAALTGAADVLSIVTSGPREI